MLVTTGNGQATIMTPDGVLHQLPYEPLTDADMAIQARYHLWLRAHEYRRQLVCLRCKETMEGDNAVNEEQGTWQILLACACRALYGTIALSATQPPAVVEGTVTDDDLTLLLAYEAKFLRARQIAEKLYCDRCFRENRSDGCRAAVSQNGLSGIVKFECRCRTIERKGLVH